MLHLQNADIRDTAMQAVHIPHAMLTATIAVKAHEYLAAGLGKPFLWIRHP